MRGYPARRQRSAGAGSTWSGRAQRRDGVLPRRGQGRRPADVC